MTGGVCLFFILSTELPLVGSDSNLSWFQVSTLIVVENMDLSDNVILSLKSFRERSAKVWTEVQRFLGI